MPPIDAMLAIDPSAAGLHVREHGKCGIHHAPIHDVERFLEIGKRLRFQRTHADLTGIVDEDVDLAEVSADRVDPADDLVVVGDVANVGSNFRMDADLPASGLEFLLIASADGETRSVTRRFLGESKSESARAAGDYHDFAVPVVGACGRAKQLPA